jgi:hypothetical protein
VALAYPDLVLGSPLGRQFLVGYLSYGHEWRELLQRDELGLLGDLAASTFCFGFANGDEAAWGLTASAEEELRPVAEALVAAPGAARWWDPVVLADQRFLDWDDSPSVTGSAVERAVRDGMRAERAENEQGLRRGRPSESPGTRVGACWWSAPDFAQLTWTTSAAGDIPATAFGHFIDTLWPFEETGVTVWSRQIAPDANVLEITEPSGWQALVARFPLRDLTAASHTLGRWHGQPQNLDWDAVRNNWTPLTGQPAGATP